MFPNYAPEQHKIESIALQDELQEAIDASMPTTYTITTKSFNMEDVLHKLFTQLYNDDLFFGLSIERKYPEVVISFETMYSKARVQEVLADYLN